MLHLFVTQLAYATPLSESNKRTTKRLKFDPLLVTWTFWSSIVARIQECFHSGVKSLEISFDVSQKLDVTYVSNSTYLSSVVGLEVSCGQLRRVGPRIGVKSLLRDWCVRRGDVGTNPVEKLGLVRIKRRAPVV